MTPWSKLALVVGIAIALTGSGIGYMVAESEHQHQGWIQIDVKNVGLADMTVGVMVGGGVTWYHGSTGATNSFSAFGTVLSANETLRLGLNVHWHDNGTFWICALYGNNATPDFHHSQITCQIVKCIPQDVVNVTLILNMAWVRT